MGSGIRIRYLMESQASFIGEARSGEETVILREGGREERRARITCAANDSAPVPRGKLAVVVLAAPGHGGVAVAVAAGAAE